VGRCWERELSVIAVSCWPVCLQRSAAVVQLTNSQRSAAPLLVRVDGDLKHVAASHGRPVCTVGTKQRTIGLRRVRQPMQIKDCNSSSSALTSKNNASALLRAGGDLKHVAASHGLPVCTMCTTQ